MFPSLYSLVICGIVVLIGGEKCGNDKFQCGDGSCVPSNQVCDRIKNCQTDAKDEDKVLCESKLTACWSWQADCRVEDGRCMNDTFQCDNGKCILLANACDRVDDCGDGSDEVRGRAGFKCAFKNGSDFCNLPARMIKDGVTQCHKKLDEFKNDRLYFRCFDNSDLIPYRQQCDGVVDCRDLSDECPCEDKLRDEDTEHICHHHCSHLSTSNCTIGTISCDNGTKEINTSQVCDGNRDCLDALDERYCTKSNGIFYELTTCIGDIYGTKNITATMCDGNPECFDLTDECDALKCDRLPKYCKLQTDLKLNTAFYHYRCKTNVSGVMYSFTAQDICNGKYSPCLPQIPDEEDNCFDRFYCNNITKLGRSIANALRCDGFGQCKQNNDEDECSSRYKCDEGLPYSVPVNYISDGIEDCADGSDECPSELDNKTLSSRSNMLKRFFRVWVWIIGLSVLAANSFVIFSTSKRYNKIKSPATNVTKGNLFLIANLAFADFIMGTYLLVVGIISESTSGSYCKIDLKWRSSLGCSVLGSIAVLSSEVSIFMLMVVASIRLYTVLNPIRARNLKFRYILVVVLIAWTIGALIAFLPMSYLLLDTFTTHAWIPSKFLRKATPNLKQLIHFVKKVESFSQSRRPFLQTQNSWSVLNAFLANSANVTIYGRLAYYSRHAICVPDLYLGMKDLGWEFPATIIIFNFLSFIYLPSIYFIIYQKTARTKIADTLVDRSQEMQRRILKLVVSDFLCWMPICIMAFLNLSGVIRNASQEIYAVTAIVLLPINSVLNPLLYSNAFENLWKKTKKCVRYLFEKIRSVSWHRRRMLRDEETSATANTTSCNNMEMTLKVGNKS